MKKLISLLGLIIVAHITVKAQQNRPIISIKYVPDYSLLSVQEDHTDNKIMYTSASYGPEKNYNFYMRKSKSNRTVGWITLGAGIVLSGIGLLVANGDYASNDGGSSTAGVITVIGAASGIVSIPFMIMASVYKHKARVMVESQKTGFGVPSNVSKYITSVSLTIPFGK